MKRFRRANLILPVFLAGAILILLANPAQAAVYYCNSCASCNSRIQDAADGDTVRLTVDIINYVGTCINFAGKDNINFDCQGHMIDGTDASTYNGILLSNDAGGSNNNTIRDCQVRDFYDGVYIYSSSNNVLTGVNATSNSRWGLVLYINSNNNTINNAFLTYNSNSGVAIYSSTNNTLNIVNSMQNSYYDVVMDVSSDSHCSNKLTNIIGSGNRPIAYYNYTVNLQNQVFAELILCNADYSQLRNITITGSSNNGLFMYRTEYATLDQITSSYNRYGILLNTVSNSVLTNLTANYNAIRGLSIDASSGNRVWNLTARENTQYDVYVDADSDSQCNNNLTNMISSSNRPIMYYNYSVTLQNQVLSELILCNADYSNITNMTILGSTSRNNNGVLMMRTAYTNLTRITSSNNYNGLYLTASSNNRLTNITANSNQMYGMNLVSSSNNTIKNVTASYNSNSVSLLDGIRLETSSNNNVFDRITANNNYGNGISIYSSSNNNTLTNIVASYNNYYGLRLDSNQNNTLANVTVNSNTQVGLGLTSSSYNAISNVTAMENIRYDVYVTATTDSHCWNNLTNIISSSDRRIMYYNYSVTLQNQVFAELILCNADYSNITNMTILGSTIRRNNVLRMVRTDYTNLTRITSSDNYYGIYLTASSNNRLTNITVRNNAIDGIYLVSSLNNIITDVNAAFNSQMGIRLDTGSNYTTLDSINAISNSQSGISIISSIYSILTNITASSNTQYGVSISSSSGIVLANVTASSNTLSGVYLSSSSNNTLTNVTANSNTNHGIYFSSSSNNTLINVTASSNTQYGIYLYLSSNNTFSNSMAENNRYDVNVTANLDSNCNNYMENMISSGGRPIVYYNSTVNLQDQVFSELILCNADNSQLKNITIAGSASRKNNGIIIIRTDYAKLTEINSSFRYYGIYISSSSNNLLENITSVYNEQSSFYILNSNYNTLTNVRASYNSQTAGRGIHMLGFSQYNTINDSRIEGNNGAGRYGVYFQALGTNYSSYNTFYNNIFINTNNFYSSNINNSNYWNITSSSGPNIIDGLYLGGNYWGGPGFSDTCTDTSPSDGICDSALNLTNMAACSGSGCANNTDYLPLTPDVGPPNIWFVWPTPENNTIVYFDYIEVNASISEPADTCLLDWYDGEWRNYTMSVAPGGTSCYLNMTDLLNFEYSFKVYANDTLGNMNVSETRQNTVIHLLSGLVLAKFAVSNIHARLGENRIVKVYVQNPDPVFANITVWIQGDYPIALAKFIAPSTFRDIYFTPDMRNFTVQLNPKNQMTLNFLVMSTGPKDGGYTLTLGANTTGSAKNDSDTLQVFVDYPANFPGLDLLGMSAIVACAAAIFWIRKRE